MVELRYHPDAARGSPFEDWFSALDAAAAAKVSVALGRLEQGDFSNAKPVGEGDVLLILLTGGSKRRQPRDVKAAKALWSDYKRRRLRGG